RPGNLRTAGVFLFAIPWVPRRRSRRYAFGSASASSQRSLEGACKLMKRKFSIPTLLLRTVLGMLAIQQLGASLAYGDEGMWLFNNPPRKLLKQRYGFEPSEQWLTHLQRSSVRFNSGGSGSFVSADGLVMTNHHVGADALQKLSSAEHNYLQDGFYAESQDDQVQCVALQLNELTTT